MPLVDRMVRVDLRTVTLTIPPQEVITRDNVPARVAAVCYFRVVDPAAAVTEIEAFAPATSQIAQTTLRSVLGGADLDQLLAERDRLNEDLQQIIDEQTEPWGIKVSTVEIKDVEIPEAMQRAMARQAEAERERRAKIINAEGEFQAAEKLAARGRDPRPRAVGAAAALPADAARDRRGPELDDRVPAAARPARAVPASAPGTDPHGSLATHAAGGRLDRHPLPAPPRPGVLRRRPARARGRGGPGPARRGDDDRDARGRAALRHRQPGGARGADRHRGRDGVALRPLGRRLLQAKLAVLVLVGVLTALHIVTPHSRGVSIALFASSLLVLWLGVSLTH